VQNSLGEHFGSVFVRCKYDTIEEFNVDSKAECGQLNLAHAARKNISTM